MSDVSDHLLADRLHDTLVSHLPAQARYAVVWVVTDESGTIDLATATLNCVANVPTDTLQRFGQMMSSRPTETLVLAPHAGSS